MEYEIEIRPSGRRFVAHDSESILKAGMQAGINLSYRCGNGSCGGCTGYLLEGEIKELHHVDYVWSEAEKAKGAFLLCAVAPLSNLVIEAHEAHGVEDMPRQEIDTRVKKLNLLQEDLQILYLRTPRSQALQFLAGQNVQLVTETGLSKELPLASCPCDGMHLEFHLRRNRHDLFDDYVFDELKKNSLVMIEGPCGEFVLDEQSERTLIMIAYDTGFAAIRSLVEHALALELPQEIYIFRLASKPSDRYLENICHAWEDVMDNVHYTYIDDCIEHTAAETAEHRVCDLLMSSLEMNDDISLAECDFYLSGNQATMDLLTSALNDRGIPAPQIKTSMI
ncbi:MAG: 2Fe-2S iron-sulfur cluster binding domain-containing protein [Gammaproteobacteria bacterium]|nr:MAG: 2Fe-2S iron-sulfur cluster binding domain-containing protein [Gammaproteobacteria bacterium]